MVPDVCLFVVLQLQKSLFFTYSSISVAKYQLCHNESKLQVEKKVQRLQGVFCLDILLVKASSLEGFKEQLCAI